MGRVDNFMGGFAAGAWTGFWCSGFNPVGCLIGGLVGGVGGAIVGGDNMVNIFADGAVDSVDPHTGGTSSEDRYGLQLESMNNGRTK